MIKINLIDNTVKKRLSGFIFFISILLLFALYYKNPESEVDPLINIFIYIVTWFSTYIFTGINTEERLINDISKKHKEKALQSFRTTRLISIDLGRISSYGEGLKEKAKRFDFEAEFLFYLEMINSIQFRIMNIEEEWLDIIDDEALKNKMEDIFESYKINTKSLIDLPTDIDNLLYNITDKKQIKEKIIERKDDIMRRYSRIQADGGVSYSITGTPFGKQKYTLKVETSEKIDSLSLVNEINNITEKSPIGFSNFVVKENSPNDYKIEFVARGDLEGNKDFIWDVFMKASPIIEIKELSQELFFEEKNL